MRISFKQAEVDILKESLHYAKQSFEKNSAKYREWGEMPVEGYYEKTYLPQLKMFSNIYAKLTGGTK